MKILVATDGSEFSLAAARKCCELANIDKDTTIKIVSVIESITPIEPFGTSDEYYILAQKAARGAAEDIVEETQNEMLKKLGDRRITIETEAISGPPKATIIEEAEDWGADLIVVGSQGRGFWGRMLLGSVSNSIVRHAHCSVLLVRSEETGEESGKNGA